MSVFTLFISCLTMSYSPWPIDVNISGSFAVLLFTASDFTFTTGYVHNWGHFPFGSGTSFFLDWLLIALCSSPVAFWILSDLIRLIFQCHIFLHFHTVHWVLEARILKGLPFLPPVDNVLSEIFTMTHLSWVALHGIAYDLIDLCKPFHHNKAVNDEGEIFMQWKRIYSILVDYKHKNI